MIQLNNEIIEQRSSSIVHMNPEATHEFSVDFAERLKQAYP